MILAAGMLAVVLVGAGSSPPGPPFQEVIAEIRVHGNHVTTDEEIISLAGVTVGAPFASTTLADVTRRLNDSNKFDNVDVLKRYASIDDPTKVIIVIIVNEGPVRIDVPTNPDEPIRVVRRRVFRNLMFMPILDAEDGYGATYGVRFAYPSLLGKRSRVSAPLTWGGFKRAGLEFDRTFVSGPFSRIEIGGAIQRRRNPAFDENDDRRRVWGRLERADGPVRTGMTLGWQRVSFPVPGGSAPAGPPTPSLAGAPRSPLRSGDSLATARSFPSSDDLMTIGADIAFDTRLDPVLPRNAVFGQVSWERIGFASGGAIHRHRLDGRGYLGLIGQTVLVLRAVREDANEPLPPYLKSLLGGWSSLRGFKAGSFFGDTLVTGSIELRIPLTSPLHVGKFGVSVFMDTGTAYDKGARFRDQTLRTGIGGSVWVVVAAFRMSLSVAHGRGATTRVNFGGGLTF